MIDASHCKVHPHASGREYAWYAGQRPSLVPQRIALKLAA